MYSLKRWLAAQWWTITGHGSRNRATLYGGSHGLRILTFHDTPSDHWPRLEGLFRWIAESNVVATPDDCDRLVAGSAIETVHDRILLTFDDGFASNFTAAHWLADHGIAAIFFVVPALLGRSVQEYIQYHQSRGVEPYSLAPGPLREKRRGLEPAQVREMASMGHRIGCHNFAHRDLGKLTSEADLHYEIDEGLSTLASLNLSPCRDFAIAFGQPENLSAAAERYLIARNLRVHMCFRGLNVPGRTPAFLMRHDVRPDHPLAFTKACIRCAGDHAMASRQSLMLGRVGPLRRITTQS